MITSTDATRIIARVFGAAELTGDSVPTVSADGALTNDRWSERAELNSHEEFAHQCSMWAKGLVSDRDAKLRIEDVATCIALEHGHDDEIAADEYAANERGDAAMRAEDEARRNHP